MTTTDIETGRSGGASWFFITLALILFLGGALAVSAYIYGDPQPTVLEAIVVGFAGLAAVIVGLIGAAIGVVAGLVGALFGILAAGGAIAFTLFLIGSPIIALILFVLLMRRNKDCPEACPDPSAHE